jgi:hypothetical protein
VEISKATVEEIIFALYVKDVDPKVIWDSFIVVFGPAFFKKVFQNDIFDED